MKGSTVILLIGGAGALGGGYYFYNKSQAAKSVTWAMGSPKLTNIKQVGQDIVATLSIDFIFSNPSTSTFNIKQIVLNFSKAGAALAKAITANLKLAPGKTTQAFTIDMSVGQGVQAVQDLLSGKMVLVDVVGSIAYDSIIPITIPVATQFDFGRNLLDSALSTVKDAISNLIFTRTNSGALISPPNPGNIINAGAGPAPAPGVFNLNPYDNSSIVAFS
jgi:hypothetical protein